MFARRGCEWRLFQIDFGSLGFRRLNVSLQPARSQTSVVRTVVTGLNTNINTWFLYPDFGRLYNFWPTFFKWHFNKVIVLRVLKKLFVYSVGNWEKKTTQSLLNCNESWVIKSLKSGEVGFLRDGPRVCRRSGCSPVYVWLAVWSNFVFIWIFFFLIFSNQFWLPETRILTRGDLYGAIMFILWLFITF